MIRKPLLSIIVTVFGITCFSLQGTVMANESDSFKAILQEYKADDNGIPASAKIDDCKNLAKKLRNFRSASSDSLRPHIDKILNNISLYINKNNFEKGNIDFSTVEYLRDKILNWKPLMSIEAIDTRRKKLEHTKKLRKKIIELMGDFPEKIPLDARVIEIKHYPGYTREKIIFQSNPGALVPGYLLIPRNVPFPAPAIVCLHQHAGEYYMGKDELVGEGDNPDQFYALELTKRGYITLSIDARLFGERADAEKLAAYLGNYFGAPLIGMIVWDDIRSVDYLLTRKEVDPQRIGCIGHSLGGVRAMFLAAIDERIKVTAISCAVTSFKTLIEKEYYFRPPSTWLPGLIKYAEIQDLLSLIAPRGLLIVNAKYDENVPSGGLLLAYKRLQDIYRIFDSGHKLNIIMFEGTHSFPKRVREACYKWLDKRLWRSKSE